MNREDARREIVRQAEEDAADAREVVTMEFWLSARAGGGSLRLPVPLDHLSPAARVLADRLPLPGIGPQPAHNLLHIRARTPVLVYGEERHEVRAYRWGLLHPGKTPRTYFEGVARQIDAWGFDPVVSPALP